MEMRYENVTACKGGSMMTSEERMAALEEENQRLKDENARLLGIIDQMRTTLNRLIGRYVTGSKE